MSGDGVAQTSPITSFSSAKTAQLEQFTTRVPLHGDKHVSVFSQAPVDNLDTSMRAGERGPTSIDDPVARERISHFDHERNPERVVHARGVGAHGVFKLHTAIPELTCAKHFTEVGKEIPVFARFSTVLGSKGAAETAREVRGFALRFFTEQGNHDIVANNIPVFFIQDGIKFVDLVHAAKPHPQSGLPQAQTAHDSFWDWISLTPESTNMIAWILSDHTIPRSYRMIDGYGVNTFVFVNAEGKRTYVKFHWKPQLGKHGLVWDEALKLAGQDPDFLRRDLFESIEAGAYPKWSFGVQCFSEEQSDEWDFDPLDCTKMVPEEMVPIKYIGEFELNKNVTNDFAETEQVAFCTSNVTAGIDYSNDPMLQLRNFSYFDTQLSRLGGPNFNQIPINRAICPFVSTARDGIHSTRIPAGPHYYPNRFSTPNAPGVEHGKGQNYGGPPAKPHPDAMTFAPYEVSGVRGKQRPRRFAEHYSQATLFWNSQSDVEKQHIIAAAQFEVGRVDDRLVQERMIERFNEIDHDLALQVAEGFGIAVPATKANVNHGQKSDGEQPLSMLSSHNVFTAVGRKVGIFVLDGFSSTQVTPLVAGLTAMGCIPQLIGLRKGPAYPAGVKAGDEKATGVQSTHFTIESCRSTYFDALFFPTGDAAYAKSLDQGRVVHFAREAFGHFKTVAACGVAVPWITNKVLVGEANLTGGQDVAKSYTSHQGLLLGTHLTDQDSSIWAKMTVGLADAANFGAAFADACSKHRHWERDVSGVAF